MEKTKVYSSQRIGFNTNRLTIIISEKIMATRTAANQALHDRVIQMASNNLDKINHNVYTNIGEQRITKVGEEYPDIIITKKNESAVNFIIEVETSDSIIQSEAVSQWNAYSKLGGTFYLLVPKDSRNLAEQICLQHNIKARFGTYSEDTTGSLQISYE